MCVYVFVHAMRVSQNMCGYTGSFSSVTIRSLGKEQRAQAHARTHTGISQTEKHKMKIALSKVKIIIKKNKTIELNMEYHGDLITIFKGSFSSTSHSFQLTIAGMSDKYHFIKSNNAQAFSFIMKFMSI